MVSLTIPDYRILRKVGSGAMGTVYEAVHIKLGRRVAIKVVSPDRARDPELEVRFVNEARALARVRHPSIVLIFEFGVLPDGAAYLVMEFLQGENLELRWQKRQRTATPRSELQLIQQLAHALALLHRHGVVHRDLKPANVMVIAEPGQPPRLRAKLVDFGLAKLIRLSGGKTSSSLIMGTPAYMSPEQCRGAGLVGAKTDCYALGVMLYELIAGILPFESAWAGDLIGMHIHLEPPPLIKLEPNVDPRLATLVHALLRKDQERRPTMADVDKYLLALMDQLEQKTDGSLPSLEPEVDPFEATRASNDVGRGAPAKPPGIALTGPAKPSPMPEVRKRMLSSRSFHVAIIIGIPLALISALFIYIEYYGKSENFNSAELDQSNQESFNSLAHQIQFLSQQELKNRELGRDLGPPMSEFKKKANLAEHPILSPYPVLPEEVLHRLPCRTITGVYQVCIQLDGSVRFDKIIVSIPGADRGIISTLAGWRYATRRTEQCIDVTIPFRLESTLSSCTNYLEGTRNYVNVQLDWLVENMKKAQYPQLSWPKDLKPLAKCKRKKTSYKVYINENGTVTDVIPLDGLFKKDGIGNQEAIAALSRLRFGPLAFPVYLIHTFTFHGSGNRQGCRSR